MKKVLILGLIALVTVACSSQTEDAESTENTIEIGTELSEDDIKQLEEDQSTNVELEKLDGELDSLLNTL